MSDVDKILIKATDKYGDCLLDSMGNKISNNQRPSGFVEIFDILKNGEKKELVAKSNLVVNLGREWLITRAFNQQNLNINPIKDEYICWFGVGDGGCPVGNPLDPNSPNNGNIELNNPVMINASDVVDADLRVEPDAGYYKHPFDLITYEQDPFNDNAWIIVRVDTTLAFDDANGFNLNEAGLYTASSNVEGYSGAFNLYARITFPTLVKSTSRQLLFSWYIYF